MMAIEGYRTYDWCADTTTSMNMLWLADQRSFVHTKLMGFASALPILRLLKDPDDVGGGMRLRVTKHATH
jgi:hypothetical protein